MNAMQVNPRSVPLIERSEFDLFDSHHLRNISEWEWPDIPLYGSLDDAMRLEFSMEGGMFNAITRKYDEEWDGDSPDGIPCFRPTAHEFRLPLIGWGQNLFLMS